MKLKNILLTGMSVALLSSCNDYLDVDAPSSYTEEFVFSQTSEMDRALNGVYAYALTGNLYGNSYQSSFILNSDVDISISSNNTHSHTTWQRFDCDDQGSGISSFWNAAYTLIEYANRFIAGAESSELLAGEDSSEVRQMIGEAKCLRAMAYHDLVVMFGDVPFSSTPASQNTENLTYPVTNRETIQDFLISDLESIAPYMSSTSSVTVERCSKEFAWGMIARIALTAGGYSLRPDKNNTTSYGYMARPDNYKEYYATAAEYAKKVIDAGTHSLSNSYQDVFVKECNYQVVNNDDPIFELPFAKESSGSTGYLQGPTYGAYEGKTVGAWGACSGSARLNAFYRFLFRDGDKRREFVNGLWYYSYYTATDKSLADSVYIRNDYSVHNNKWSKLWTDEGSALGNTSEGSTGINYPYMRYADVLLMYAEAANEINEGPTDEAMSCLKTVHNRAFDSEDTEFFNQAAESKDAFLTAVLDERKWEFAGENSRWRDLVRTNKYAEELVYSFLRYYSVGMQNVGSPSGFEDAINLHDGYDIDNSEGYIDNMPERIYYHTYTIDEANAYALRLYKKQLYGYTVDDSYTVTGKYPNQSLKSLRIYNAYEPKSQPTTSTIKRGGFSADSWLYADFYQWGNADDGTPKDQCKYSFYGYIRADSNGNIWIIDNGTAKSFSVIPDDPSTLPVVRYILPYPNAVIQKSSGVYKNYYGY